MSALAAFLRRDLTGWRGLPPGTTLADVAQLATVDKAFAGSGKLCSRYEPADWVTATADGFPWGIRIWYRGDRVVLLDAEGMQPAGDIAELGPPQVRWDACLASVPVAGSEWVYPERGLTVYAIPGAAAVDRVLAYTPTTVDEYARSLRPQTQTIEEPA